MLSFQPETHSNSVSNWIPIQVAISQCLDRCSSPRQLENSPHPHWSRALSLSLGTFPYFSDLFSDFEMHLIDISPLKLVMWDTRTSTPAFWSLQSPVSQSTVSCDFWLAVDGFFEWPSTSSSHKSQKAPNGRFCLSHKLGKDGQKG